MANINFDTLQRAEALLARIDAGLGNHTRFWTDFVAPFAYSEIDDIFETGGRGAWADLDPRYTARKTQKFPGKGILRREDTYFKAATGPNRPGSIYEVSPTELVVGVSGSTIPYVIFHEEGEGRRHRPVYDLIEAGERFEERMAQLGEKWQQEEIAAAESISR